MYEQVTQSIDDLLQHASTNRLEVLTTAEIADSSYKLSGETILLTGKLCVHVSALCFACDDACPLALVDVHAAAQSRAQRKRLLNPAAAAQEVGMMVNTSSVARIEQSLSAVDLSAQQARILQIERGNAGLLILRHYFDTAGKLIAVANSVYRSDQYTFRSTLRRA